MAGVCSAFRSNAGRTEVEDEGQVAAATELAFVCLGLQAGEHLQVDGNARDLHDAADALLFSAGQLELALSSQSCGFTLDSSERANILVSCLGRVSDLCIRGGKWRTYVVRQAGIVRGDASVVVEFVAVGSTAAVFE